MDLLPSLITSPSLPMLFVLSFLAATILPIGSEWLLIVMIIQKFTLADVVFTATLGNFLGACSTYLLGILGANYIIRNVLRINDAQLLRAEKIYARYGTWSLLSQLAAGDRRPFMSCCRSLPNPLYPLFNSGFCWQIFSICYPCSSRTTWHRRLNDNETTDFIYYIRYLRPVEQETSTRPAKGAAAAAAPRM